MCFSCGEERGRERAGAKRSFFRSASPSDPSFRKKKQKQAQAPPRRAARTVRLAGSADCGCSGAPGFHGRGRSRSSKEAEERRRSSRRGRRCCSSLDGDDDLGSARRRTHPGCAGRGARQREGGAPGCRPRERSLCLRASGVSKERKWSQKTSSSACGGPAPGPRC